MPETKTKDAELGKLKLLGAQVKEEIYWEFKKVASDRKESMQEAIIHAAMLYMDLKEAEYE